VVALLYASETVGAVTFPFVLDWALGRCDNCVTYCCRWSHWVFPPCSLSCCSTVWLETHNPLQLNLVFSPACMSSLLQPPAAWQTRQCLFRNNLLATYVAILQDLEQLYQPGQMPGHSQSRMLLKGLS